MAQQPTAQQVDGPPHAAHGNKTSAATAQPIDQLQGLLNIVLMTIGSVISNPEKRKDPGVARQYLQVLPQATHKFHEALDKLEEEIQRAQMVMRRDLSRYMKESKAREAADLEMSRAEENKIEVTESARDEKPDEQADVQMQDAPEGPQPANQSATAAPETADGPTEASIKPQTDVKDEEPPNQQDLTAQASEMISELPSVAPAGDDLFGPSPSALEAPAANDINLDDIFGLPNNATPNETANLGADALADGELDLSFPMGDAGGDDGADLLAGLESYANIPDAAEGQDGNATGEDAAIPSIEMGDFDFSTLDLPGSTAVAAGSGNQQQAAQTQAQAQQDGSGGANVGVNGTANAGNGANEFEDLFSAYYGDDTTGADASATANGDDDWAWLNG